MAKLYFRYGAMNSGKTTAILQAAHNYEERGMTVLLMKPDVDVKGNNNIVSRLGIIRKVDIKVRNSDNIEVLIDQYIDRFGKIDCILVDEVQFLRTSHINSLFRVAVLKDIPVMCYGLRTDFLMQEFPASARLLAIAHKIEELKTICRCGKKAVLNMRVAHGEPVFEGDQIAIDGEGVAYESVCGSCYQYYRQKSVRKDNALQDIAVTPKAKRIHAKSVVRLKK